MQAPLQDFYAYGKNFLSTFWQYQKKKILIKRPFNSSHHLTKYTLTKFKKWLIQNPTIVISARKSDAIYQSQSS